MQGLGLKMKRDTGLLALSETVAFSRKCAFPLQPRDTKMAEEPSEKRNDMEYWNFSQKYISYSGCSTWEAYSDRTKPVGFIHDFY